MARNNLRLFARLISRRALLSSFLALIFSLSSLAQSGGQPQSGDAADRAAALTAQLMQLAQQVRADDPSAIAQLRQIAADRQAAIAELLPSNAASALRLALPPGLRSTLPDTVQDLIEHDQDAEGDLSVEVEDRDQSSTVHFFLAPCSAASPGCARVELFFASDPPGNPQTGDHVQIHGTKFNAGIALECCNGTTTSSTSYTTTSPALSNTLGAQKTLVILVNFQDLASTDTVAHASSVVFGDISNFDLENSFQQTSLTGDVAGIYTIPVSSTSCATSSIQSYAQKAASAAGYNLSNYSRFLYGFPQTGACSWWGYSYIGGSPSNSWVNGQLAVHVVGHELGHAFGLFHSHSLSCGTTVIGSGSPPTGGCTINEYGDTFDMMDSSAYSYFHFNSFQKSRLGWLGFGSSPPIQTVTASGTYQLVPYETLDNGVKSLKVLQSSSSGVNTWYYVEFRQAIGFDNMLSGNTNVLNGVVLHLGTDGSGNSSQLLNMTPGGWWSSPALAVGQSYTDSTAGVTFTVVTASSTGATVQVAFGNTSAVTTCTRANPTVSMTPSQSQGVAAGSSVGFAVTVVNNDSSGCSSSTFNLTDYVPSGWTAGLTTTSLILMPGSSGTATLQVTSPAGTPNGLYTITGSVTNAAAASNTATTSATYVVQNPAPISMSVNTDQATYTTNQFVTISVSVLSGSTPAAGAGVAVTITPPTGSPSTLTGTTGSNGVATIKYRLAKKSPIGTYGIAASASFAGQTTQGGTNFRVQ